MVAKSTAPKVRATVAPAARRLDRRRLGGASRPGAFRDAPASRWRSSRRAGGATMVRGRARLMEWIRHV